MTSEAALARTGRFARGARIVKALPPAPTKSGWVVERGGERFVMRVDTPLARALGLERPTEIGAMRAAARRGLAPAPVLLVAGAPAVTVVRWAPGAAWGAADLRDDVRLARLARLLARLHALPPPDLPRLDPAAAMARYAGLAGDADSRARAREGRALARALAARAGPAVLCHHDPVAGNVVGSRNPVLIDWEYAALGDPLLDLAVVIRHHRLSREATNRFLEAYAGGARAARASVPTLALITPRLTLYDHLSALWRAAVQGADNR